MILLLFCLFIYINFQMKSKKVSQFPVSPQDVYISLGQKNQTIFHLEKEVQDKKILREKYARLTDHKQILEEKCRNQLKENAYLKDGKNQQIQSLNQNFSDLKVLRENLERESKSKTLKVKNLKIQNQNLINYSEQFLTEIMEKEGTKEELLNKKQTIKGEKQKLKEQELCLRDEIEKEKYEQKNLQNSVLKVRNKLHGSQSLIRDLEKEEEKINNALHLLEEENNSIDAINEEIEEQVLKINNAQQVEKEKIEGAKLQIKVKEIEKGRMMKEINEKRKLIKVEHEKFRYINELIEKKFNEYRRTNELQNQAKKDIETGLKENVQIEELNYKLHQDLRICQSHLQNIQRNNVGIEQNLHQYENTNKVVIKKLQKVTFGPSPSYPLKDQTYLCQTADSFLER